MTLVEKIVAHVLRLGILESVPEDTKICRTYAGHHQLSAGAFRWFLGSQSSRHHPVGFVGSGWRATLIARCDHATVSVQYGDWHLDPCEACLEKERRRFAGG